MEHYGLLDLPAPLLAKIFTFIPPAERLRLSEACRCLREISKIPWTDLKLLNLSDISFENWSSVIELATNARTLNFCELLIPFEKLAAICGKLKHLRSVKLHNVKLAFKLRQACERENRRVVASLLSGLFELIFPLEELRLNSVELTNDSGYSIASVIGWRFPVSVKHSLQRLQLSNMRIDLELFIDALYSCRALERLILNCWLVTEEPSTNNIQQNWATANARLWNCLATLGSLKELSVVDALFVSLDEPIGQYFQSTFSPVQFDQGAVRLLCSELASLKALFILGYSAQLPVEDMVQLISAHRGLRMLFLGEGVLKDARLNNLARFDQSWQLATIPSRRHLTNPTTVAGATILHVLLESSCQDRFTFAEGFGDGIKIWRIDRRYSSFRKQLELETIFDGLWTTEIIRDAERSGFNIWRFHD